MNHPEGRKDMTLDELAARCEAATGPDREIDAAIARCFCHDVESDDGEFWWGPYDATPERVPDFTASLDAAMTLVPEGCYTKQGTYPARSKQRPWAQVYDATMPNFSYNECTSATPALALCAAALRSRKGGE